MSTVQNLLNSLQKVLRFGRTGAQETPAPPLPELRQRLHQYTMADGSQQMSFLSIEDINEIGWFPGEAMLGEMPGNEFSLDRWKRNSVFLQFLHRVIKDAGPGDPDLQAAAKQQANGYAYVIDLRTAEGPQGRVPPEDIIGSFPVKDGKIVRDGYSPNEKYQVLTKQGFTTLPIRLHIALIQAMKNPKLIKRPPNC